MSTVLIKQARILTHDEVSALLHFVDTQTRYPLRNRVIVLLGLDAGLRSLDIARLTWGMVDRHAIPLVPDSPLDQSLRLLRADYQQQGYAITDTTYVIQLSKHNQRPLSRAMSIRFLLNGKKGRQKGWFDALGFDGCSSHSLKHTYDATRTHRRGRRSAKTTTAYRDICFSFHAHECVVCGEAHVVAVHHYDRNPLNNDPENLIPLCPTHHQYCHTGRLYPLVAPQIDAFRRGFRGRRLPASQTTTAAAIDG